MPTSSFARVLAAHPGPYLVAISLDGDEGASTKWLPDKVANPLRIAVDAILSMPDATSASIWCVREQRFATTIRLEEVGLALKEADSFDPVAPGPRGGKTQIAPPATGEEKAWAVELRAAGMGYKEIDSTLGRPDTHGNWSWRLLNGRARAEKRVSRTPWVVQD